MIVYKIENYQKEMDVYRPEKVCDCLVDDFYAEEFDAIEASSWCELAYAGEIYQGDGFTITVTEE